MDNLQKNQKSDATPMGYDTLLGIVVSFPENNEMIMFQDFAWWKGIPANIKFRVESVANESTDEFWLVADGYGNLSKPNSYGNGKIGVKRKYILEALSFKCCLTANNMRMCLTNTGRI